MVLLLRMQLWQLIVIQKGEILAEYRLKMQLKEEKLSLVRSNMFIEKLKASILETMSTLVAQNTNRIAVVCRRQNDSSKAIVKYFSETFQLDTVNVVMLATPNIM